MRIRDAEINTFKREVSYLMDNIEQMHGEHENA